MEYVTFAVMLLLALLMIPFSPAAFSGAADGLRMFGSSVFPSLFPFIVCSHFIMGSALFRGSGNGRGAGPVLMLLLSALCGTPSSAIMSRELCANGSYPPSFCSVLCAAFNLTGPMFIISTLAGSFLKSTPYAYAFAASHYIPPLIFAVILSLRRHKASNPVPVRAAVGSPLERLSSAISDAVLTVLRVGGTLVFFRVVFSVADACGAFTLLPPFSDGLITGLLEMTNGLRLLTELPSLPRLSLCAFLLSFGGLSLFIQSKLIFPGLSAWRYLITKLIFGAVSVLVFICVYPLIPVCAETFGETTQRLKDVLPSASFRLSAVLCGCAAAGAATVVSWLYSMLAGAKKRRH